MKELIFCIYLIKNIVVIGHNFFLAPVRSKFLSGLYQSRVFSSHLLLPLLVVDACVTVAVLLRAAAVAVGGAAEVGGVWVTSTG